MPHKTVEGKAQHVLLAEHFLNKSTITAVEAAAMYRIRSLSRRINDLEATGWTFRRESKVDPTGQRYVRYIHIPYTKGLAFADR